jgi:Zn-dependent protease
MDIFGSGIPLGRWFGINVRLHFTFLIYAFYRIQQFPDFLYGFLFIAGLYICILLHEFGHALAARWADGEANDILLWPLGGLAYCRPAWHPTAHLICTAAGPFVTFLLFVGTMLGAILLRATGVDAGPVLYARHFLTDMAVLNLWLLIFNLIPAFPMDGGRILRDILWHWMSAEKATGIAVWAGRFIAGATIVWAIGKQDWWLVVLAVFILMQGQREYHLLAFESAAQHGFSLRERLRRGSRQRAFRQGMAAVRAAEMNAAFHRCTSCGRTERDDPHLEFRICTDCSGGQEYCREHLNGHPHI